MKLRYAGVCRVCGAELAACGEAIYERSPKTVRYLDSSHSSTAPWPCDALLILWTKPARRSASQAEGFAQGTSRSTNSETASRSSALSVEPPRNA
jgi:hypothetical protein